MAKLKHEGQFKPGQSGNPSGRKPLPDDIKAARNLSYEEMCRTVIMVRDMTLAEIRQLNKQDLPLGKRAIINAYQKFNYKGIKEYEDRLWGKARETIDLGLNLDELDEHQLNKLNEIRKRVLDNG